MATKATLPKQYDFKEYESRLYAWWEEQGFFQPEIDPQKESYTISMPPPNVTGELHLGHAMFVAMEDLMIRHQRMSGRAALWLPGTDHAGIATQLQVEKHLMKTEGKRREEIGREAFEAMVWDWKRKYGGIITDQLRRLGASCDWSRERFTLDEGLSHAVREAFVRLYEKGLIYRGSYMINWSPGLRTAVSDLEVEYSQEVARLYYFNYPLEGGEGGIPVATTRPETILGDTAVAVHPEDERFKDLIGKTCLVPMLNRPIPVIADVDVDPEFGTGALKITPGHDHTDYEIGKRHRLPRISVLNKDATMNENAGPYAGQDRYECRENLWADMEAAGLAIRVEPYTMQVPRSQRGGEVVEPMVSTQWFVRMKTLADPALEAVRQGAIEIVPERFSKVYFNWLENIRDWCISRQLWWGHRIPAWHCQDCGEITVARQDPAQCEHCGSNNIEQDPDVLDTWFSSGLWPFSTLGWPEETQDFRSFYPTTMMETGYDILFFWVARMIMMGMEFTEEAPFSKVYLHGLVRDEDGRKMSKSLGNVIDPLQVMDEYGTDALRFTLLTGSTPGNDMNLSLQRVESNRNFANKLWNAGRLILSLLERAPEQETPPAAPGLADRWIMARAQESIATVNRLFDGFQYGEAGRQMYDFFWSDFADWYLEIAKLQVEAGAAQAVRTLQTCLEVFDACLRILHPFTPFVTEALWGHLKAAFELHPAGFRSPLGWQKALIVARWPEVVALQNEDRLAIERFEKLRALITAIRNIRSERAVEPGRRIAAIVAAGGDAPWLLAQKTVLCNLAYLDSEELEIHTDLAETPADALPLVVSSIDVYLPLAGMMDLDRERQRLTSELQDTQKQIARLGQLLAGPFAERAPQKVVLKERDRLSEFEATAERLRDQIEMLG